MDDVIVTLFSIAFNLNQIVRKQFLALVCPKLLIGRSIQSKTAIVLEAPKTTACNPDPLWVIQSKQNFVWKNWPFLAALAGLNFQVQFSMPYSIRFKRFQ